MKWLDVTRIPDRFFDILPEDWQEDIKPIWNQYESSSHIYLWEDEGKIAGGGIVFSKTTPDMMYAREIAEKWFAKGYLYIGFLWVNPEKRGQHLGSLWLKKLYKNFPDQKYWLTIEDFGLEHFYERNGFRIEKELVNENKIEKLMVYDLISRNLFSNDLR